MCIRQLGPARGLAVPQSTADGPLGGALLRVEEKGKQKHNKQTKPTITNNYKQTKILIKQLGGRRRAYGFVESEMQTSELHKSGACDDRGTEGWTTESTARISKLTTDAATGRRKHIYICAHIYIYIYICVCVYIYIYTCVYIYIYNIYIYIQIHNQYHQCFVIIIIIVVVIIIIIIIIILIVLEERRAGLIMPPQVGTRLVVTPRARSSISQGGIDGPQGFPHPLQFLMIAPGRFRKSAPSAGNRRPCPLERGFREDSTSGGGSRGGDIDCRTSRAPISASLRTKTLDFT